MIGGHGRAEVARSRIFSRTRWLDLRLVRSTTSVWPAMMISRPNGIFFTSCFATNWLRAIAYMMKMSRKDWWLATYTAGVLLGGSFSRPSRCRR